MKKTMRIFTAFLAVLLSFSFVSCKKNRELDPNKFYIYYLDSSKNDLYPVEAFFEQNAGMDAYLASVWERMTDASESSHYVSPIPENLKPKTVTLSGNNLVLNFDEAYYALSPENEVLMRAAIVKTFTQILSVLSVEIQVEGQPLILSDGTVVGPQKGNAFVDVFGTGMNAYKEETVALYFADETGTKLLKSMRTATHRTSVSTEQYAVQMLISGPESAEGYRTVPYAVKLVSVNTADSVCHVTFATEFLTEDISVLPEVVVYSIVDTLTEISGITAVQISVTGVTNHYYKETVDLSQPLYRNLDYVTERTAEEPSESDESQNDESTASEENQNE